MKNSRTQVKVFTILLLLDFLIMKSVKWWILCWWPNH